jgi:hypothetical protein
VALLAVWGCIELPGRPFRAVVLLAAAFVVVVW